LALLFDFAPNPSHEETCKVVIIPTDINGLTVSGFGTKVFHESSHPAGVTIPGTITSFGTEAFLGCCPEAAVNGSTATFFDHGWHG
jgi:hypothetical protein